MSAAYQYPIPLRDWGDRLIKSADIEDVPLANKEERELRREQIRKRFDTILERYYPLQPWEKRKK